jgi:glutamate-1-semialdehyde aminotransferase
MDQLSPLGPVYQAGTLSGNPLAMAAGLAQLRELERIEGWKLLEKLGAALEAATRESLGKSRTAATFHRLGSMFCLFFTGGPVTDLESAKRSDLSKFVRLITVSKPGSILRRRSSRPASSPPRISRSRLKRPRGSWARRWPLFVVRQMARKTFASSGSLH